MFPKEVARMLNFYGYGYLCDNQHMIQHTIGISDSDLGSECISLSQIMNVNIFEIGKSINIYSLSI